MKLVCPQSRDHKNFLRESYDSRGNLLNLEIVDEFGRFLGDWLDLYTGDVSYRYLCAECRQEAMEVNSANS